MSKLVPEQSGVRIGVGRRRRLAGFGLLEMIAAVAILAILAVAAVPVFIKQIDLASERIERGNLATIAAGLTQGCIQSRYIPNQANWVSFIATNIGWQTSGVQTNGRNNPRVLLIDPQLLIGATTAASLPYVQPATGAGSVTNVRFMVLSSLSSPLPAGLVSGPAPAPSDFNALWNSADDTIPPGTSWSFNTWTGKGEDLKIQRINLSSCFSHLVLTVNDTTNAPYSLDSYLLNSIQPVYLGVPFDGYVFNSTVLNLYYRSGGFTNLQASQILQRDSGWEFSSGLWRNSSVPAPAPVGGTVGGVEPIVQTFYGVSPGTAQAYSDMTNYMNLYLQYAASNFTNGVIQSALGQAAQDLGNDANGLVP